MKIGIVKTGGKQYIVKEGDVITVEKLMGKAQGDSVMFDVLLVDDGSTVRVGKPLLSEKASGELLENGKAEKKIVVKYKAKSRYYKKRGHRQPFARVRISKI